MRNELDDARATLAEWLNLHNARVVWEEDGIGGRKYDSIVAYALSGGALMLIRFYHESGFEVFVPASQSNRIDKTLAAAEQILGLTAAARREVLSPTQTQSVKALLRYSFAETGRPLPRYEGLTSHERTLVSREDFQALVDWSAANVEAFEEGDRVRAVAFVTEGGAGHSPDENEKEMEEPGYVHARAGELGSVVHVNDDGLPTVQFDRTGTATIVGKAEVELLPLDATKLHEDFVAWRAEVDCDNALDTFDLALGFASGRGFSHDAALEFADAARKFYRS